MRPRRWRKWERSVIASEPDFGSHADQAKPLCDIDVQNDGTSSQEGVVESEGPAASAAAPGQPDTDVHQHQEHASIDKNSDSTRTGTMPTRASLATPAVRGLLKALNVKIEDVVGTGKDGRVLKEDVHKFAKERDQGSSSTPPASSHNPQSTDDVPQTEKQEPLTRIQSHMFNAMTRSLSIPHFLYADEIDLTPFSTIRRTVNANAANSTRLSLLPFIIKALSIALADYPLLNSRVETNNGSDPPQLVMRSNHNIGIAMDTPQGLLVPNIKNVSSLSIYSITTELKRLQELGQEGKLGVSELTGGTITVSNIGSIGGTYLAPVLVSSEVAILGIGKSRIIPAFDEQGALVKKEIVNFSWSADHRVIDGATMARMAECVRGYVEKPGSMLARLR